MAVDTYAYWRAELKSPGSQSRDTDQPIHGFWRIVGARTKPDFPFAVWGDESGSLYKIGRRDAVPEDSSDGHHLRAWSWPKAVAVEEPEYKAALLDGVWSDGKPSRQPGAIVDEPATEGQSNYAPANEVLKERVESLLGKIEELGAIDTQQKADTASELGMKLKAAILEAEKEEEIAAAPHRTKLSEVHAAWKFAHTADTTLTQLRVSVRQWLRDEEARRAKEAASDNAIPPPKVSAAPVYGRATTLRTAKKGEITDIDKFIKAVKKDPDIIEALQRKANALARAGTTLPGMKIIETRV